MDNKSVHVVFPKQYKDILHTSFKEAGKYNIAGFDTDITNYAHFILDEDTNQYSKAVLISTFYDATMSLPFMSILADTVEQAIKIKLARQDLRLIFVFPTFVSQGYEYREYISKLIMAGIYDLHFYQDFEYLHIEGWLDNVQQIIDVKEYITTSDIPKLNQQIQVEQLSEQTPTVNVSLEDHEKISTNQNYFDKKNESANLETKNTAEKDDEIPYKPKGELNTDSKNNSTQNHSKIIAKLTMPFSKSKKEEPVKPVKPLAEEQVEKMEMVMMKGKATKKIGVIGLTKSVGTSFITTNFASYLSDSNVETGVYESPVNEHHRTYLADQFGFFDEENPNQSLPHAIVNKQEFDRKKAYKIKNVYYYPTNYMESPILEFPTHEIIRYVNTGVHSIKLMDLGHITELELINRELLDKLSTFDALILVVNPLPTKVIPNTKNLLDLQHALNTLDIHYVTVLNQYQGELPKGDLKIFDLHKGLEIPCVNHSVVIKAMYKKTTSYDYDTETRNLLKPYFVKLANQLDLPIQMKQQKEKSGFLKMVK
ncbi:hypothetical protein ACMGD3_24200 [Lysinibacillus sphaericus]|uniref:hypothetical protein n=1 Tax=Lysinibacillus sphaericus TaxID=1421 RepID=UPI003F7953FC